MPSVQTHCEAPQSGCCPVDPKEVAKAQKEALHAQHEAAEACHKQQAAIDKANRKIADQYAKQQKKIDKANAKLNDRAADLHEANSRYESFFGGSSEAVAEATPQPAPEVKQPEPAPLAETTPEQPTVQDRVAILEIPAAPSTEPAPVEKPKELPRTASPLSLIGLLGLMSMSGYTTTRFFRRK